MKGYEDYDYIEDNPFFKDPEALAYEAWLAEQEEKEEEDEEVVAGLNNYIEAQRKAIGYMMSWTKEAMEN